MFYFEKILHLFLYFIFKKMEMTSQKYVNSHCVIRFEKKNVKLY